MNQQDIDKHAIHNNLENPEEWFEGIQQTGNLLL